MIRATPDGMFEVYLGRNLVAVASTHEEAELALFEMRQWMARERTR